MPKIAVEFTLSQIENILKQLKSQERVYLLKKLFKEDWAIEFESIASQIRKKAKKNKVNDREIIKMVEEVRNKIYGQKA